MTNSDSREPQMRIRNIRADGNGKGGVRITAGTSVDIDGVSANNNGGPGFEVSDITAPTDPWYRRPLGVVFLAVCAGVLVSVIWKLISIFFS